MMKVPDTTDEWRKPSFSAQETDCFEVRRDLAALRDSKNPNGPILKVDVPKFAAVVKAGRLTC